MEVSKRHWCAKTHGDKCVNVLMVLVVVPTEVGLKPIRTHATIQASTEQVISDHTATKMRQLLVTKSEREKDELVHQDAHCEYLRWYGVAAQ